MYTYHFNLRDIYGGVGPKPIYYYHGFDKVSEESAQSAMLKLTMQGGKLHFLEGNKIFAYLWRNLAKHANDIITFVVPGLRQIYYKNINLFNEEKEDIININKTTIDFYNVYNYGELSQYYYTKNVNEYQLIGTITKYDVLFIPVAVFIALLNTNTQLEFRIDNDIIIYIDYNDNDFFDLEYQKNIRYISYEPYIQKNSSINWDYVKTFKK